MPGYFAQLAESSGLSLQTNLAVNAITPSEAGESLMTELEEVVSAPIPDAGNLPAEISPREWPITAAERDSDAPYPHLPDPDIITRDIAVDVNAPGAPIHEQPETDAVFPRAAPQSEFSEPTVQVSLGSIERSTPIDSGESDALQAVVLEEETPDSLGAPDPSDAIRPAPIAAALLRTVREWVAVTSATGESSPAPVISPEIQGVEAEPGPKDRSAQQQAGLEEIEQAAESGPRELHLSIGKIDLIIEQSGQQAHVESASRIPPVQSPPPSTGFRLRRHYVS